MNIALPPDIENRMTADAARLHMAIGLFAGDEVTLGQAAAIAGLSHPSFLQELGKRKIAVHYGPAELDEDISTVQKLTAGPAKQ